MSENCSEPAFMGIIAIGRIVRSQVFQHRQVEAGKERAEGRNSERDSEVNLWVRSAQTSV